VITLDTSGLVAYLNVRDPYHDQVTVALQRERGPYIIPVGILAEIAYFIEQLHPAVLNALLDTIEKGGLTLDCGDQDIPRIHQLVNKYSSLPLGFADAAVIACAERNGGRVLTLDMRHFSVVAREGTLNLLPGWGNP